MSTSLSNATTAPARVEPNPRWIRGYIGDRLVVDSRRSAFVWEVPYYPQWYFPIEDVAAELRPTGAIEQSRNRGTASVHDLVVDGTVVPSSARRYEDSPIEEIRDRVRIEWDAIDRWLEEDQEVIVHPRSPYTRVDVLPTSRHVVIAVDGVEVANSTSCRVLYETGLPARYYFPADDVRTELLTATASSTACPYKGIARYWSVELDGTTHEDLVWGYDDPLPESAAVKGLLCFYNEKVDITVDDLVQDQPVTKFS